MIELNRIQMISKGVDIKYYNTNHSQWNVQMERLNKTFKLPTVTVTALAVAVVTATLMILDQNANYLATKSIRRLFVLF